MWNSKNSVVLIWSDWKSYLEIGFRLHNDVEMQGSNLNSMQTTKMKESGNHKVEETPYSIVKTPGLTNFTEMITNVTG